MTTQQTATARTAPDVSGLSLRHIDAEPVDRDWTEGYGESWEPFEVETCETCGAPVVGAGYVECEHDHDDYPGHEDDEPFEVYVGEGPMMSYAYPCDVDDPEDAAAALDGLPLCIVRWDDGTTGLALTGGGMDLTWEIAEAYVRLGFLPPLWHARSLPRMAGREAYASTALVLAASIATVEAVRRQTAYALDDLERMAEDYGIVWPDPVGTFHGDE